jgi:hypothetical protein
MDFVFNAVMGWLARALREVGKAVRSTPSQLGVIQAMRDVGLGAQAKKSINIYIYIKIRAEM